MSPSKRLKPVQRVAHSREQNAARSMGLSRKNLLNEETKLEQLRAYHQEYLKRFESSSKNGMSSTQLQEYRAFLAKLDAAIKAQEGVVSARQADHASSKNEWIQKHTRTQALNKVVERFRQKEQKSADRIEQKESDERNQRIK